jgi:5-methylcytosine-specific restriction endonuclease McrA
MATRQELMSCFKMPTSRTVTGRISSIRNAFAAAIVPVIRPTVDEIATVLSILRTKPTDLRCSYCGDPANQWDHFKPSVMGGRPTGYPSSIRNLVPSCGSCNQSKGNKHWKTWMTSSAKLSPASRRAKDLDVRVQRLEAYERWADCGPIDIEGQVDRELWDQYNGIQNNILSKMSEAQQLAVPIRETLRRSTAKRGECT